MKESQNLKFCNQCLKSKSLDHFYAHPKYADGKNPKCKDCMKKNKKDKQVKEVLLVDRSTGRNLFGTTDGQGGAFWFDFDKFLAFDRHILSNNNLQIDRNIRRYSNRRLFNTDKQKLIDIAIALDMNPDAVYLIAREEKYKDKEKFCLNLLYPKGLNNHAKNY